jgi:hypothetical protein
MRQNLLHALLLVLHLTPTHAQLDRRQADPYDEPGLEPTHLGHRKHTTHAHGTRFDYVGAPEKATKQYARDDDERTVLQLPNGMSIIGAKSRTLDVAKMLLNAGGGSRTRGSDDDDESPPSLSAGGVEQPATPSNRKPRRPLPAAARPPRTLPSVEPSASLASVLQQIRQSLVDHAAPSHATREAANANALGLETLLSASSRTPSGTDSASESLDAYIERLSAEGEQKSAVDGEGVQTLLSQLFGGVMGEGVELKVVTVPAEAAGGLEDAGDDVVSQISRLLGIPVDGAARGVSAGDSDLEDGASE